MQVSTVVSGAAAVVLLAAVAPAPAVARSGAVGSVQVIQADPGDTVTVSVDGKHVRSGVTVGAVIGPITLSVGHHVVRFADASGAVALKAGVNVDPGSSADVVLHRPASVSGAPVVNVYATPRKPIGPGKARVLLAHTATVAPADVRVDGKTVFTNIANGEYADADVPAGRHQVELLATGTTTDPILGPVPVDLSPQTVTMAYAVGRPSNGSMDVIAHTSRIRADGAVVPVAIDTGSAAALVAGVRVRPFTARGGGSRAADGAPGLWAAGLGGAAVVLLAAAARTRRP